MTVVPSMMTVMTSRSSMPTDRRHILLVQDGRSDEHLGDTVRVAVGRWSPVLQVPEAVLSHRPRDADAGVAVGDTCRELEDRRSFVETRQTALVVLALVGVVHLDVTLVGRRQLLDGCVDDAAERKTGTRINVHNKYSAKVFK